MAPLRDSAHGGGVISANTWAHVSDSSCEKRATGTLDGCSGRTEKSLMAVSSAKTDLGSHGLCEDVHRHRSMSGKSLPSRRGCAIDPAGGGVRVPLAAAPFFFGAEVSTSFIPVNLPHLRTVVDQAVPIAVRAEPDTTDAAAPFISGVEHYFLCARPFVPPREHLLKRVVP